MMRLSPARECLSVRTFGPLEITTPQGLLCDLSIFGHLLTVHSAERHGVGVGPEVARPPCVLLTPEPPRRQGSPGLGRQPGPR